MTGSEFARALAAKGPIAWEAAALEEARRGNLTPWPVADVMFSDGQHSAILKVATDVLSIGPVSDHLRLPLTPGAAQAVLNLTGSLLPTPKVEYQTWRQAPIKLEPKTAVDLGEANKGASMAQYQAHSAFADRQIAGLLANAERRVPGPEIVSGHKKAVVVSNLALPDKVLIFGWYRPPPFPDVFDDGRPQNTAGRQPIQPHSNLHGAGYVDYSHGIRAVGPIAIVDGQPMRTEDLYRHPTLSRLVSHEGPIRHVRYPSTVPALHVNLPPASFPPPPMAVSFVPHEPSLSEEELARLAQRRRGT